MFCLVQNNTNALSKVSLRGVPACGRQETTKQSQDYGVRLPGLRAETPGLVKYLVKGFKAFVLVF